MKSLSFFAPLVFISVVAFIGLLFMVGPFSLAYDIHHVAAFLGHPEINPSPWKFSMIVGGFFLSEIAVPAALVIWVLVTIGVMP